MIVAILRVARFVSSRPELRTGDRLSLRPPNSNTRWPDVEAQASRWADRAERC